MGTVKEYLKKRKFEIALRNIEEALEWLEEQYSSGLISEFEYDILKENIEYYRERVLKKMQK